MQLHMDRWLLAALLLSAVCCSAVADGDHVDAAANWFNTVNTTICSTTACPAGQYANPADAANPGCKPCMIGTYKAAAGATCCEKCKSPELTFNSSDAQLVLFGATGCGEVSMALQQIDGNPRSATRRCHGDSVTPNC